MFSEDEFAKQGAGHIRRRYAGHYKAEIGPTEEGNLGQGVDCSESHTGHQVWIFDQPDHVGSECRRVKAWHVVHG